MRVLKSHDGLELPVIGLGTYGLNGDEGLASIKSGIDAGYRLLDTAVNYGNEAVVGQAVRECDVARQQLIVTTKVPGRHHGFDETMASFEESRRELGLEKIDLYLIHWPNPSVNRYVDTWHAMVELWQDGLAGSIGVCNFTPDMMQRLFDATGVWPSVNQVELHPYFPQDDLRNFHQQHGILTQAWSPLGRKSDLLENATVRRIAETLGVSPTQAVLRWHVQRDTVAIPKSANAQRQRENLNVFGFELSDDDMSSMSALSRGRIWDADPLTHEEM